MKQIIIIMLIAFIAIGCSEENQNTEDVIEASPSEADKKNDETEKLNKVFNEFKSLYEEMSEFKNEKDFEQFGLGNGGPYVEWVDKVKKLEQDPNSKLLMKKGVVTGDLMTLGMSYATSKGAETDVTKNINTIINAAISKEEIDIVETESGNNNYNMLVSDYDLMGKWIISNSQFDMSYRYEIYTKENEYIGVLPDSDYATEILDKKGNNYYVKGNKHGEYYKITQNNNMSLYDDLGELASSGFEAIEE